MRKSTADQKVPWLPAPPLDFGKPYALANYSIDQVSAAIAKKYLDREANLKRAWARICTHLPETLETKEKLKIIEFSTAHGAMLEIWNAVGHDTVGTDFCVPEGRGKEYRPIAADNPVFGTHHSNPMNADISGWIYQPIIESIGAEVHLFDAGQVPYAYEDKSFDYLCCYQAIEAYAEPDAWDRIIDEFCRITRRAIVIGFNPPPVSADKAGWEKQKTAWENLRQYRKNGFTNVFFEIDQTQRGVHPTACKLVADCV